jgi:hypothetical protein
MPILQLLTSFPTAVPTVLLAVLTIYWLMSIIGIIDLGDSLHIHTETGHLDSLEAAHGGHEVPDLHTLAGYLVALGLGGVPLSVVASVLVFVVWLGTALLHNYVIAWLPTALLRTLSGVAVLLLTSALSIPIAARVVKPMRGLFVKHSARSNSSLVGLECKIMTETVDPGFGRAEVANSGGGINIRVWASAPNTLRKHSKAIIVAYDETSRQYEVQAAPVSI